MGLLARCDAELLTQRGHLFPWTPVFLALGVGGYFLLRVEPGPWALGLLSFLGALGAFVAYKWPGGLTILGWCLALFAVGAGLAAARAHRVSAPVLDWRYYGPVEGRIVGIDRSGSDALRLTLDMVRMKNLRPDRLPDRVRISLHGPNTGSFMPGQTIMTTAHLSPPQGPVEPGGFDFRRHAWFQSLGAVGYTRVPVLVVAPQDASGIALKVTAIRLAVSRRVQEVLPGDIGGFAAAVTTGDRSGVSQQTLQDLRDSNLAHLLAISGLHMGLLAGFVFAGLRITMSLIPSLALRIPVRKIAAVGAFVVAAGYLALSGGNVATERAFVMTGVMLGAVLVDRRAFSLRAVAMAALIVLILRPEALLSPGFQMSFAATTALVAVFCAIRDLDWSPGTRWRSAVFGLVVSSAVAGLATGPVGAAHFNTMSHYGLIANLLCVPLMGILIIPSAVLALCLAPFGAEALGLELMGLGLRWVLGIAHWVAGLPGAVGYVKSPDPMVLPILAIGALWLVLWQGRLRFAGLVPMIVAFAIWSQSERPEILIADSGGLVGVMTEQGRALSKPKGAGFVAEVWLENDGDGRTQSVAASVWPGPDPRLRTYELDGTQIMHVIGKRSAAAFSGCNQGDIAVFSTKAPIDGPCLVLDPERLRETGAISIGRSGLVTAQQLSGRRIWSQ